MCGAVAKVTTPSAHISVHPVKRHDEGGTVLGVSRRRERSLTRTPRIRSGVGGGTGCFEARLWNSDEWACAVVCGFPLCSYGR